MSNSGSSPPSGNNGGWWSRMSRSEQTMAAIAGAVVAGIFAVIVALIGHSSSSSQDPQAGQPISVAKSPQSTTTQHAAVRCSASYPLVLQIPPETGANVSVTVKAVCATPAAMTYLIIEKIPNVDPKNPHPVYYIKATIPHLDAGQTSSENFVLNEPFGTKAQFLAISVNGDGLRALSQNRVVDNGILSLPPGALQESPLYWHTKVNP